ncbi:MAG: glycosyl hydrolase [Candidatus Shapirobacteria bacterium]
MKKTFYLLPIFVLLFGLLGASYLVQRQQNPENKAAAGALILADGPHLFLDDYLIESKTNIIRKTNQPARNAGNPVIPSIEMENGNFNCTNFNYEVEVVFDPKDSKFKMWYRQYDESVPTYPAHSVYRESSDGINWGVCQQVAYSVRLDDTQNKGLNSNRRFISSETYFDPANSARRGMDLFSSANGINWQEEPNNPVLTYNKLLPAIKNDIWDLYYDPLTQKYGVLSKPEVQHSFTDSGGRAQDYQGRTTYLNTSTNLISWTNGTMLFPPSSQDEGQIQWYGCANAMRRGDHLICFSKVLHDDFKSPDTPDKATTYVPNPARPNPLEPRAVYGIGYTVLAYSHNGIDWQRDRVDKIITGNNPKATSASGYRRGAYLVDLNKLSADKNVFFAPNPDSAAWDHAHAWIDSVVEVGDLLYFYYGGYKFGHKVYSDRGLGLAILKKDRYAGQYVGKDTAGRTGILTTKTIKTDADKLYLNLDTGMSYDGPGQAQMEILDVNNPNRSQACTLIGRVDEIRKEAAGCNIADFKNRDIKLKFTLKNAMLYAIYLDGDSTGPAPTSGPGSPTPTLTPIPTLTLMPSPTVNPSPGPDRISAKKGAATLYEEYAQASELGVSSFYRYSPYSASQNTAPMLKKSHIDKLRANPDPENCSVSDKQAINVANECPARGIKQTVERRGQGGYWLILNEPEWEEDAYYHGNVNQMADDIAFTIRFIKQYDPGGKFIVAWYHGIPNAWFNIAQNYGLSRDYQKVFAGWHIHLYHWQGQLGSTNNIDAYFNTFKNQILNHRVVADKSSWGAEVWLTEFGTLMTDGNCNSLSNQTGCECRFDRIDNDPNQLCVNFMQKLVNWLESDQSPVDRYFWWSFGRCDPSALSGSDAGSRNLCFGALTNKEGNNISLNNLGRAFAALPFESEGTPTPTPTPTPEVACPAAAEGNLNCDLAGIIDELDLAILLSSWKTEPPAPDPRPGQASADINHDQRVDFVDLQILMSSWTIN